MYNLSRRIVLRTFLLLILPCHLLTAQTLKTTGAVSQVQKTADSVTFRSGDALVRISTVRPGVVRLRYSVASSFPADHSFAILPEAKVTGTPLMVSETSSALKLSDGEIAISIDRGSGRIVFSDKNGNPILADALKHPAVWQGSEFRVYKTMPPLEQYFGLGDKTVNMDRRGNAFTNWNTDIGPFRGLDPIYKTIPFFIGLNNGRAYGIFLDNTYRTSFDFGKQSNEYFSFGSTGGELNYYFIAGPHPQQIGRAHV